MEVDPLTLSIYERLTKYPDSYSDEELLEIAGWYAGEKSSGQWSKFPPLAFLILEERKNRIDYTKEEK